MIFKSFPIEYQMDSQDCGPACLKIIAKYFGKYYSLQYLRDKCGIMKDGVSLLDISTGAENIGLRTLSIQCTMETLINNVPLPAIIYWKENHFIVIFHVNKRFIWVSDPAKGKIKYTHQEFEKGWYKKGEKIGILMAIEPTAGFKDSEAEKEVSLHYS